MHQIPQPIVVSSFRNERTVEKFCLQAQILTFWYCLALLIGSRLSLLRSLESGVIVARYILLTFVLLHHTSFVPREFGVHIVVWCKTKGWALSHPHNRVENHLVIQLSGFMSPLVFSTIKSFRTSVFPFLCYFVRTYSLYPLVMCWQ